MSYASEEYAAGKSPGAARAACSRHPCRHRVPFTSFGCVLGTCPRRYVAKLEPASLCASTLEAIVAALCALDPPLEQKRGACARSPLKKLECPRMNHIDQDWERAQ